MQLARLLNLLAEEDGDLEPKASEDFGASGGDARYLQGRGAAIDGALITGSGGCRGRGAADGERAGIQVKADSKRTYYM